MAKGKTVLIRLVSMAGTGFAYTSTKNPVNVQRKLLLRKYDPVLGAHTHFKVCSFPYLIFDSLSFLLTFFFSFFLLLLLLLKEERISRRRIVQGK